MFRLTIAVFVAAVIVSGGAWADRFPKSDAATRLDAGQASLTLARRLGTATAEGRAAFSDAKRSLVAALDIVPTMTRAAVLLGEVLLETEEHAEADRVLTKALTTSPNDLELMHMLGVHRFRLGDGDRAEALLEAVAAAEPRRFDVTYLLAGHYYRLQKDDRALKFARAYLRERPKDVSMHGLVGNLHLRAHRVDDAIKEFDTVLSLDPTNLPVRVNLGNVLFGLDDYARAIQLYEGVLAQKPGLASVQYNLGTAYYRLDRYGDASKAFGAYIEQAPSDARGHYYGGVSAARSGARALGLDRLRRATELDPKDPWAPYAVADLARKDKDLSIAETYVGLAIERKPAGAVILRLGGLVARDRGDLPLASRRLELAQTLAPRNAAVRAELGQVRFLLGNDDLGIDDLEAAAVLDAREPRVVAWLPVARIRRAAKRSGAGQDGEAEADLRRALEIAPRTLAAYWNLAWLYDARGDGPNATRTVRAALAVAPDDPDLHLFLAYLDARSGRYDDAATSLAKADGASDAALRWLVQGALHGAFGEFGAAIGAFEQARSGGIESGRALVEARLDAATAQLAAGRPDDALRVLRAIGAAVPEDSRAAAALEVLVHLARDSGWERFDPLLSTVESGAPPEGRRLDGVLADARLLRAYAAYRLGDVATAAELLEPFLATRPGSSGGKRLLVAALLDLAEEQYSGRSYETARAHVARAAELAPNDALIRHAEACLAYTLGREEEASRVFASLAGAAVPPESVLNLGIYLADIKHEAGGAAERFRRYLGAGGIAETVARQRLARFERVFGR